MFLASLPPLLASLTAQAATQGQLARAYLVAAEAALDAGAPAVADALADRAFSLAARRGGLHPRAPFWSSFRAVQADIDGAL